MFSPYSSTVQCGYERHLVPVLQLMLSRVQQFPICIVDQNNDARSHRATLYKHIIFLFQVIPSQMINQMFHCPRVTVQVEVQSFLVIEKGFKAAAKGEKGLIEKEVPEFDDELHYIKIESRLLKYLKLLKYT